MYAKTSEVSYRKPSDPSSQRTTQLQNLCLSCVCIIGPSLSPLLTSSTKSSGREALRAPFLLLSAPVHSSLVIHHLRHVSLPVLRTYRLSTSRAVLKEAFAKIDDGAPVHCPDCPFFRETKKHSLTKPTRHLP
jgi:hypothetical protein